jgi:hypothetical protein
MFLLLINGQSEVRVLKWTSSSVASDTADQNLAICLASAWGARHTGCALGEAEAAVALVLMVPVRLGLTSCAQG